jgi:hypothetical protein
MCFDLMHPIHLDQSNLQGGDGTGLRAQPLARQALDGVEEHGRVRLLSMYHNKPHVLSAFRLSDLHASDHPCLPYLAVDGSEDEVEDWWATSISCRNQRRFFQARHAYIEAPVKTTWSSMQVEGEKQVN